MSLGQPQPHGDARLGGLPPPPEPRGKVVRAFLWGPRSAALPAAACSLPCPPCWFQSLRQLSTLRSSAPDVNTLIPRHAEEAPPGCLPGRDPAGSAAAEPGPAAGTVFPLPIEPSSSRRYSREFLGRGALKLPPWLPQVIQTQQQTAITPACQNAVNNGEPRRNLAPINDGKKTGGRLTLTGIRASPCFRSHERG